MTAPLAKLLSCLRLPSHRRQASKATHSDSSSIKSDEKTDLSPAIKAYPGTIPGTQSALILHGIRQPYQLQHDHPTPKPRQGASYELQIRTSVIGINPIDWKAPDYNFGIPELPYISGREFSGYIVAIPPASTSISTTTSPKHRRRPFRPGDHVLAISTDYRDLRKAAYQHFPIANAHNVARIPSSLSNTEAASLGVAFIAAALSLGICTGLDFSSLCDGPDLLKLVRESDSNVLPEDIREECLSGIDLKERLRKGDWLAVWGGSSTSAYMICQLARLVGVRTASVLDVSKHGGWLYGNDGVPKADVIVDSHDPQRAVEIVRSVASSSDGSQLRFGIDTVGKTTAADLLKCLLSPQNTASTTARPSKAHLVGLTDLPKRNTTGDSDVKFHSVPIKLFHEVPSIGEALMVWLEKLLENGLLKPPRILAVEEGLGSVNGVLDRMRRGEVSGGRAVVRV